MFLKVQKKKQPVKKKQNWFLPLVMGEKDLDEESCTRQNGRVVKIHVNNYNKIIFQWRNTKCR